MSTQFSSYKFSVTIKRIIGEKLNFLLNYLGYCLVSQITCADIELDEPIVGNGGETSVLKQKDRI